MFSRDCVFSFGRVLTRKYFLTILSEKKRREPFYFDKKTRLSSNDSQHYLKILSRSAGQPRRQHEHGAKIRRATEVL